MWNSTASSFNGLSWNTGVVWQVGRYTEMWCTEYIGTGVEDISHNSPGPANRNYNFTINTQFKQSLKIWSKFGIWRPFYYRWWWNVRTNWNCTFWHKHNISNAYFPAVDRRKYSSWMNRNWLSSKLQSEFVCIRTRQGPILLKPLLRGCWSHTLDINQILNIGT